MTWKTRSLWYLLASTVLAVANNINSLEMSVNVDWQLLCGNRTCSSFFVGTPSTLSDCQLTCLSQIQCQAATYQLSTSSCQLISNLQYQTISMVVDLDIVTMMVIPTTRIPSAPPYNWLINGDAETGPCELGYGVTHPTGWNYNGPVTQISYSDINSADFMFGPNDHGNCYFCGQYSSVTSMWQIVNLTNSINPTLLDSQTMSFNFSAWIGGYSSQDDDAQVSLVFINQNNGTVGNTTTLGPIFASDRDNMTSLLFQQAVGSVPVGTRSFIVTVIMTRFEGSFNDGYVDNIIVSF